MRDRRLKPCGGSQHLRFWVPQMFDTEQTPRVNKQILATNLPTGYLSGS